VVHESEGVPFILETSDNLPGIHPEFDNFEGDLPPEWGRLLSQVNDATASFAKLLAKLIRANVV